MFSFIIAIIQVKPWQFVSLFCLTKLYLLRRTTAGLQLLRPINAVRSRVRNIAKTQKEATINLQSTKGR